MRLYKGCESLSFFISTYFVFLLQILFVYFIDDKNSEAIKEINKTLILHKEIFSVIFILTFISHYFASFSDPGIVEIDNYLEITPSRLPMKKMTPFFMNSGVGLNCSLSQTPLRSKAYLPLTIASSENCTLSYGNSGNTGTCFLQRNASSHFIHMRQRKSERLAAITRSATFPRIFSVKTSLISALPSRIKALSLLRIS